MNAPAGWYPDPTNGHITRYWDGDRYTHERHWDGSGWVDPAAAPASPATPAAQPASAYGTTPASQPASAYGTTPASQPASAYGTTPASQPASAYGTTPASQPASAYGTTPASTGAVTTTGAPSPTVLFWLFLAGSVGVAISAFLPWVSVSGLGQTISSEPGTGGPPVLLVFAAGVVALAWPTLRVAALSQWRRITLLPVVGFLVLAVLTNGSDLSDLMDRYDGSGGFGIKVNPGAGYVLYMIAVVVLVVAVVKVWRLAPPSGRRPA